MPFDGGEFSQAPDSHPPIPAPPTSHPSAMDRLRRLFQGDPPPEQAGRPCGISTARLLEETRALIQAEEAWRQGAYRAPDGKRCAVGALRAAARKAGWRGFRSKRQAHTLLLGVVRARGFVGVELMNDHSTHAQVLAAFDAAIARAGGRSPRAG